MTLEGKRLLELHSCVSVARGMSHHQSMKFISNQIKKLDIQCTLYNIHENFSYSKHVTTFSLSLSDLE